MIVEIHLVLIFFGKAQMVNATKLLIKKDFSDEEISTITQLSIEEIKALHNS